MRHITEAGEKLLLYIVRKTCRRTLPHLAAHLNENVLPLCAGDAREMASTQAEHSYRQEADNKSGTTHTKRKKSLHLDTLQHYAGWPNPTWLVFEEAPEQH